MPTVSTRAKAKAKIKPPGNRPKSATKLTAAAPKARTKPTAAAPKARTRSAAPQPAAPRTPVKSRRRPAPRKALAHLHGSDPILAALIDGVGPDGLGDARAGRPEDHYGALVRSIVGQQLSTRAARSIFARLTEIFGGRTPTPTEILAQDAEELRLAAGLSRAKASYLRSLAEHVLSGELELELLDELPDEEVIAELVAVKGLGVWTAHMFLMFHLQRPDVLPVGDLGIRRAIERGWKLPELPDADTIQRIAEPWRPYRTLACRYLWRSLDNEPA